MSCLSREMLAAYLDGEATANQAKEIEGHFAGCAACRASRDRLARLIGLAGEGPLAREDGAFSAELLERVRGMRAPRRLPLLPVALALGSVAALLFFLRGEPTRAPEYAARGGENAADASRLVGFEAFVHPRGNPSVRHLLREGERLHGGDGLSFTLYNRSGARTHFMLFGVDSKSEAHWFYPAYAEPGANPSAPALEASPQVVPLDEGVTPENPAPGPFAIVAVFSSNELRVSEVEALLRDGGVDGLRQALPSAIVQQTRLEISR